MRAVVIREPGGPEVLEVREVPTPLLSPEHVRVQVAFAGVNRADLLQRMGLYPAPPGVPPDIPGLEYAGAVSAIGAGVTRFAPGDRVLGIVGGGAYAEEIVVHEREVVLTPPILADEDAAALPEAFLTAWDALVVRGRLQPGERVLIHAVGSGVGTAAAQLAAALGCQVIGTSRTAEKLERARRLGLDVGIVVDKARFAHEVRHVTGGHGADVVVDLVGGAYVPETIFACAPRGRIVLVGLTAGRIAEIDLALVLRNRIEIIGTVLRSRPLEEKIEAARMLERSVLPLFVKKSMRPVIDQVYGLSDAARAHDRVAGNATFGKVLLRVQEGERPTVPGLDPYTRPTIS